MMAIRDNPIAAKTMGINTPLVKTTTFGISAMYAGIGGALFTYASEFVSPDAFNFFVAVYILVGFMVGGIVSIPGAIFSGLFIVLYRIVPKTLGWHTNYDRCPGRSSACS